MKYSILKIIKFNKFVLISAITVLNHLCVNAQSGCTDRAAKNFDKNAKYNDGSCLYDSSNQTVFKVAQLSALISESSGLVFSRGFFWTHNDSGNPNSFFKVDTLSGKIVQTIYISNFPNTDWEDISADDSFIYLADCGNNDGTRRDLKILKVSNKTISSDTGAIISVQAEAIRFNYTDQTSFISSGTHNFDCESIISKDSLLYLFTKDRGDLKTRVYRLSKTPGNYSISPIYEFNSKGLVTGADYDANKNLLVLIGYQSSHKNSFIWYINDFSGDSFFYGNKRKVIIGNSVNDWQTEGICILNDKIYLSCETSYLPAGLFVSNLNSVHSLSVSTVSANFVRITPNPADKCVQISTGTFDGVIQYILIDSLGKIVLSGKLINQSEVDIEQFPNGTYILQLISSIGVSTQLLLIQH